MESQLSISMTSLINVANLLYLVAYFVRDMLLLRILTMIGATLVSTYLYNQPQPLMVPVYWNALFILINLFWTVQLVRRRHGRRFGNDASKKDGKHQTPGTQVRCREKAGGMMGAVGRIREASA